MDAGNVVTLPESVMVGPGSVIVVGRYTVLVDVRVTSRSVVVVMYDVWKLS